MITNTILRHALGVCLAASCAVAQALPAYTFTDLGSLGGGGAVARGLNDAGQIVGRSLTAGGEYHATLWSGSTIVDLAPGPGFSEASAINATGAAVGSISGSGGIVWGTGPVVALGAATTAAGINASGQIVGSHGALPATWIGGTLQELATLGGSAGWAEAIDDAGRIAGFSSTATGRSHATAWSAGVPTDLGTLGGGWSEAHAINGAGDVAGLSELAGGDVHAALWRAGGVVDLGAPAGTQSEAFGMNDAGAVVGRSFVGFPALYHPEDRALLWQDGAVVDLNTLLDPAVIAAGWVLQYATDINEAGYIVGHAFNSQSGADTAFLLAPVPLPGALLLFAPALGFALRRRR
jgi:probable HAF family extracellular repeat protein